MDAVGRFYHGVCGASRYESIPTSFSDGGRLLTLGNDFVYVALWDYSIWQNRLRGITRFDGEIVLILK